MAARKQKKNPRKILFNIVLVLMLVSFGYNSIRYAITKSELKKRKADLEAKIREQHNITQEYNEEMQRVGTPEYYEYLARKYLGYIYPDEKVLIVVDDKNASNGD